MTFVGAKPKAKREGTKLLILSHESHEQLDRSGAKKQQNLTPYGFSVYPPKFKNTYCFGEAAASMTKLLF